MAVYKVPQDVEAEDKLIGPFGFRQFIYLIVAAIGIGLMWALGSFIFIGLAILPFPIVAFFLILALPLRKDQPMEAYLAAMVQFFLKPKVRYWSPDGSISQVEITAPKVVERQLTKDFTGEEASERFAYLAQVIDTGGWAARGVTSPNDSMSDIVIAEAQQAEDVLDDSSDVGQSFEQLIASSDTSRKQAMLAQLKQSLHTGEPATNTQTPTANEYPMPQPSSPTSDNLPSSLEYNPYPTSMHQRVIKPGEETSQPANPAPSPSSEPQPTPSPQQPSPDIIRLANNNDLSISAIAREAHRVADAKDDKEVVVSLH